MEARDEGMIAYDCGIAYNGNPYQAWQQEHEDWQNGWTARMSECIDEEMEHA